MSRAASAVPSWLSSFAAASFVGAAIRDRRTWLREGVVAATVAAVAGGIAYGDPAAVERSATGVGDDVVSTHATGSD